MRLNKKEVIKEFFALESKLKKRPTKHDSPHLYYCSRKYFGSWNKMLSSIGYSVKIFQDVSISDRDLNHFYYFLGLLSTDGHIVFDRIKKKYRVIIFTSNIVEKDLIVRLIENLFNYIPYIRSKKYGFAKKIGYEIYINSKKLCEFLVSDLNMPSGKKSLTIEIPEWIMESDNKKLVHFVRGVFDGDGSIVNSQFPSFKIPSGSKRFIAQFNDILTNLNIKFINIRQERENLWVLRINQMKSLVRLYPLMYKNCGDSFYPRKKMIWEKILFNQ